MKPKTFKNLIQILLILFLLFIFLRTFILNFDFEVDLAGNNPNLFNSLLFVLSSFFSILISKKFNFKIVNLLLHLFWFITLFLSIFTLFRFLFPKLFLLKISYIICAYPIIFSIFFVIVPLSGLAIFKSELYNLIFFVIISFIIAFISMNKNKKTDEKIRLY